MAEYNPFKNFNPAFTQYHYLEPEISIRKEDPLFGTINAPNEFTWTSTGNLAPKAAVEKVEIKDNFDTGFMSNLADTHAEPSQEISNKTYTTKQDLQGNKKRAMEFFQSKGLSAHQAAGIVGNLITESSLNTTIKGDGGKAFGLAQWHPDRQQGLKALAKKRGTDISDFDTQLEYIWEELNTGYKSALSRILNSRNTKEATTAFMTHYEKPGIPHFEKRLKEAEALLS